MAESNPRRHRLERSHQLYFRLHVYCVERLLLAGGGTRLTTPWYCVWDSLIGGVLVYPGHSCHDHPAPAAPDRDNHPDDQDEHGSYKRPQHQWRPEKGCWEASCAWVEFLECVQRRYAVYFIRNRSRVSCTDESGQISTRRR